MYYEQDYEEPDPYECPECGTPDFPVGGDIYAERDGERVKVAWTMDCPKCGHRLDSGPTRDEERRMMEEHHAAEQAYYEAERKSYQSVLDGHECAETLPFFRNEGKPADANPERYVYRKGCPACAEALSYFGWHQGKPWDYHSYPDPDDGGAVQYDYDDNDLPF